MAKEQFVERTFSAGSLALIEQVQVILTEYAQQGYRLSLRQLYYQLVARDLIANTVQSYKRVGSVVSDARMAGLIDWLMIEDRGRESVMPVSWNSPAEIVRAAADQFRVDRWDGQPAYVEVMVEKDALSGILQPVCRKWHVRFTANKGYSSSSAMYEAGKRFEAALVDEKECYLLYLGDHDPSGIDMTRDIGDRLHLFAGYDQDGEIAVQRLALNIDQVKKWKPPRNPAKESDSRFAAYVQDFGKASWELDAVEPATLARLVEDAIQSVIDSKQWQRVVAAETRMKAALSKFADGWEAEHGDHT